MTDTLLASHEGESGTFHYFWKNLGLDEVPGRPPLEDLIRWGWIRPAFRIRLSRDYLINWSNYPNCPADLKDDRPHSEDNRDIEWFLKPSDVRKSPTWFLHPYFDPGTPSFNYLRDTPAPTRWMRPRAFRHPRGLAVRPYSDYYFHWQLYRLIEILDAGRLQMTLFATPDAGSRYANSAKNAMMGLSWRRAPVGKVQAVWEERAAMFTALSHYRALRYALLRRTPSRNSWAFVDRGARDLAKHLGVTPNFLESFIHGHLLRMSHVWSEGASRGDALLGRSTEELRNDIMIAVEWACKLSGHKFDYYFDRWSRKGMGHCDRHSLAEALPYEHIAAEAEFVATAGHYLKGFNAIVGRSHELNHARVRRRMKDLLKRNAAMWSFVQAFKSLHDQLGKPRGDSLDFRNAAPLDQYRVLAIQGELVLQHSAESIGQLVDKNGKARDLFDLIVALALAKRWPQALIAEVSKHRKLMQLRQRPADPLATAIGLSWSAPPQQQFMLKSTLAFVLVRNYLAHHDYKNAALLYEQSAGYGLASVLLTVLLLGDPTQHERWIH